MDVSGQLVVHSTVGRWTVVGRVTWWGPYEVVIRLHTPQLRPRGFPLIQPHDVPRFLGPKDRVDEATVTAQEESQVGPPELTVEERCGVPGYLERFRGVWLLEEIDVEHLPLEDPVDLRAPTSPPRPPVHQRPLLRVRRRPLDGPGGREQRPVACQNPFVDLR